MGSRILYLSRNVSANRRYYGLYQAPCKDTCEEEEEELSAVLEEIKEGRRIKEEFLGGQPDDSPHMASDHLELFFSLTDLQLMCFKLIILFLKGFGRFGAYNMIRADESFTLYVDHYNYNLVPFQSFNQIDSMSFQSRVRKRFLVSRDVILTWFLGLCFIIRYTSM